MTDAVALAAAATSLDLGSDEYSALVRELQQRGDRATFDLAVELVASSDVRAKVFGLDVLGQLDFERGPTFLEETLPIAIAAADDPEPLVTLAAVEALGRLFDERGLHAVLRHCRHDDDDVRAAVATALGFVAGDPPADEAVAALIELSADPVAEVRDWATFELGSILEVDSPAVRDALAARLDDEGGDTSGEALVGLAVRGDDRAFEPVLRLLAQPTCGNLIVEAAAAIGSPLLLPQLLRLKEIGWDVDDPRGEWLGDAIAACSRG